MPDSPQLSQPSRYKPKDSKIKTWYQLSDAWVSHNTYLNIPQRTYNLTEPRKRGSSLLFIVAVHVENPFHVHPALILTVQGMAGGLQ